MADRGRVTDWAETPLTIDEIRSTADDARLDDRVWVRLCSKVDVVDPGALLFEDSDVAAYLATRAFEWEVGNGGLHQYFFNFPREHIDLVLRGYRHLGLDDIARVIEKEILPVADAEGVWRESRRDGTIETFFDSYGGSRLPALDELIELHDHVRIAVVRDRPQKFAR